uniref:Capsid protein n=1 Tax=Lentinula edodes partitivirus 1 TaxID=1960320 RepID=A0A343WUE7_9VIRU|nr:capsid protein [Lentinula edodes partitivirus 1]AWF73482.1 capsid protein [Lentinula edodes partitivirus 1]
MVSLNFDAKNSTKLRSFAQKFERPPPPDGNTPPQPKPRNDIWSRLDLAENISVSNPLSQIIDKVPDVRFMFMYIVFMVGKAYPELEQNGRPILTPSSLVAYSLFMIYGFMLVNDFQGRTRASYWAHDFMDLRARKDLYNALLKCYVPPFLMDIFHGISDTADPRRKGLEYFTSLAASMFETDFGRIIPPQIFLYAHNMSCESDTSRNVAAAITALLSWNVFQDGPNQTNIYTGYYFSAGTEDGTYHSFMYQTLNLLFSPVTGKSITRRTNLQAIPTFNMTIDTAQTGADDDHISNPYVMFLNSDNENVFNTMKFLQEFSALVKIDLKGTTQLGAVPDGLSGVAILNHGYTIYPLPTWHSRKFDSTKIFDTATSTQYAAKIDYLQKHSFTAGTSISDPDDTNNMVQQLYLKTIKSVTHKKSADPDNDIKFDKDMHIYPRFLWMLPYEEGDGPIGYAMLTGSHIEIFEIDGTSIPGPNAEQKLSDNNSLFAQGALPLDHVVKGYGSNEETRINPVPRAQLRTTSQQISHDLYNVAINRLGIVDGEVEDNQVPQALFGFERLRHVRGFNFLYSKISFIAGNDPNIGTRRLPVWSPYRYIHNERNTIPAPKDILMFTNFRAMYGTHIPLQETQSPAMLIPTS